MLISKYFELVILTRKRQYISFSINSTAKVYDFEEHSQNSFDFGWLHPCLLLDPFVLKIETKKLLTDGLNLKGGEGFSS
jgi:hypothetical protein